MTCETVGCGAAAKTRGLCSRCYQREWHAAHPSARAEYMRRARAANPREAEERRVARTCRDCGTPVGHRRRLCDECRAAVLKRKGEAERSRYHEMVTQLHGLRSAVKPGRGKRPGVRDGHAVARHIGVEAGETAAVALLHVVAHDPCAYCGASCEAIDHVVPLAAGGDRSVDNITAACQACNSRKGRRPLLSFLLTQSIDKELEPLAAERVAAYAMVA